MTPHPASGSSWPRSLSDGPPSRCFFSPVRCLNKEAAKTATSSASAEKLLWSSLLTNVQTVMPLEEGRAGRGRDPVLGNEAHFPASFRFRNPD